MTCAEKLHAPIEDVEARKLANERRPVILEILCRRTNEDERCQPGHIPSLMKGFSLAGLDGCRLTGRDNGKPNRELCANAVRAGRVHDCAVVLFDEIANDREAKAAAVRGRNPG